MNRLQEIVDRFAGTKIFVVGDAMTDVYHFGRVTKLSQEAPVPVFVTELTESRPGGAANVSNQLQALGCDVTNSFAVPAEISVKRRWIQGTHQVFREDFDRIVDPDTSAILKTLEALGCWQQALVLSDYAKGWLAPVMCQRLISPARALEIPIVVDPKGGDWSKYKGATVICPNNDEVDAADEHGWWIRPYSGKIAPGYNWSVVHKRGEQGLSVFMPVVEGQNQHQLDIQAQTRHVYDVTGAGDTVTALIAAGLAVGASLFDAARLANLAAGWVVGEVGTAACSASDLMELAGGLLVPDP